MAADLLLLTHFDCLPGQCDFIYFLLWNTAPWGPTLPTMPTALWVLVLLITSDLTGGWFCCIPVPHSCPFLFSKKFVTYVLFSSFLFSQKCTMNKVTLVLKKKKKKDMLTSKKTSSRFTLMRAHCLTCWLLFRRFEAGIERWKLQCSISKVECNFTLLHNCEVTLTFTLCHIFFCSLHFKTNSTSFAQMKVLSVSFYHSLKKNTNAF